MHSVLAQLEPNCLLQYMVTGPPEAALNGPTAEVRFRQRDLNYGTVTQIGLDQAICPSACCTRT